MAPKTTSTKSTSKAELKNKTILITGGTGSFGEAASEHLLTRGVKNIRILSRDEAKQDAMRHRFNDPRLQFYLGDIRDRRSVDKAMEGVDMVFHAAALKQVPSCENFPEQAVQTNILGSENIIESAYAHGVERAVFLSTDKAVYPINAMGLSKALMEKLVQARANIIGNNGTKLISVRYGNVVHSRGSVVPLFIDQIRQGKPLTLTIPTMTRFLMTLDQAFGLIEMALTSGGQGDTLIRKAPAATVADIADAVKQLYGSDNQVKVIGIRPGEKLHETLCTFSEMAAAEDMGDYLRIPHGHHKNFSETKAKDFSSDAAKQLDVQGVAKLLMNVPQIRRDQESWTQGHAPTLGLVRKAK
ncbi:MAG: SDR family NAD(P)-dependent oxidoreductase [Proteobacteria bacterium]|nr:SDR family NAD(P)-dependent oxidoreductase [Pseudomonadota bacterium]